MPALATRDAEDHALTVDVGDLELQEFTPTQARAVEGHQHRPVVEVLRAGDQPTDFVGAQDGRQPTMAFRRGQLFFQLAPLEDTKTKRSAATCRPTVPTASFFSSNRYA